MASSNSKPRSRVDGRTNDGSSSEIEGLRSALRDRMFGLVDADVSTDKMEPKMGSVSTISSAPNFRLLTTSSSRPGITPISSPVFAGFGHIGDPGANRRRDEDESHARYEREMDEITNPEDIELIDRVKEVADFYAELHPHLAGPGGDFGTRETDFTGLSPYFSSTLPIQSSQHVQGPSVLVPDREHAYRESISYPQTQLHQVPSHRTRADRESMSSPQTQFDRSHLGRESTFSPPVQLNDIPVLTGGVPDRFRAGRESLSVIRNVTENLSCNQGISERRRDRRTMITSVVSHLRDRFQICLRIAILSFRLRGEIQTNLSHIIGMSIHLLNRFIPITPFASNRSNGSTAARPKCIRG